jgi:hypothetical protein
VLGITGVDVPLMPDKRREIAEKLGALSRALRNLSLDRPTAERLVREIRELKNEAAK